MHLVSQPSLERHGLHARRQSELERTGQTLRPRKLRFLFAVVGDGRRWCIPSDALVGKTSIALGGPRYAEFEVEPARPLPPRTGEEAASTIAS